MSSIPTGPFHMRVSLPGLPHGNLPYSHSATRTIKVQNTKKPFVQRAMRVFNKLITSSEEIPMINPCQQFICLV